MQGATITIVKSTNGYLFGGYSSVPWASNGQYKHSPGSFLFTLTNPNGIPPTRFFSNGGSQDIYCHQSYGPTFGSGHDLYIVNNCNTQNCSSELGNSFYDNHGYGDEGYTCDEGYTFTGSSRFTVSDIEVFLVK